MDHLKFVETPLNKGIEKDNIWTAQIYAQTKLINFILLLKLIKKH